MKRISLTAALLRTLTAVAHSTPFRTDSIVLDNDGTEQP